MALWRCVKCGGWGRSAPEALAPAAPSARPRWRVWGREDLIACPVCGDRKGHAGIMVWEPEETRRLRGRALPAPARTDRKKSRLLPVHRGAAERAEFLLARLWDRLDREETVRQLMALRGYPEELAAWMADVLQVRWFEGEALRRLARGLPEDLEGIFRPLHRTRGFLLPVRWWLPRGEGLALAGLQARVYSGEARYLTLRLFRNWTPPAGLVLPPPGQESPLPPGGVILTEGWLKAAVAAFYMGRPAVGFLGLPRACPEVARLLSRGFRVAILAPDRDKEPETRAHVLEAFKDLAGVLFRARVWPGWASWEAGQKGIDDALLAHFEIVIFFPEGKKIVFCVGDESSAQSPSPAGPGA